MSADIDIRLFAAARAAAGLSQTSLSFADYEQLRGAGASAREALVTLLTGRHPTPPPGEPALHTVLEQSSFLVDGQALTDGEELPPGCRVDVLPPFAGG